MYQKGELKRLIKTEEYYIELVRPADDLMYVGDRADLLALFWDAAEALGLVSNADGDRYIDRQFDPGIFQAVVVLQEAGVETFESCEGGCGHAYSEPSVRFHGSRAEGLRALAVAIEAGLNVAELRRVWPVRDQEPTGPWWELTFAPTQARGSQLKSPSAP